MIEIKEIKIPVEIDNVAELEKRIMKKLRLNFVPEYHILKRSIDARKKPEIFYIYRVGVNLEQESGIKIDNKNIMLTKEVIYQFPVCGQRKMKHHPLVIGSGPAGLFCGLLLAKMGYVPVIVEQGSCVTERVKKVEAFWNTGSLDKNCNVQFGEGGAGTFSDGKLNTQVKDKYGRIHYVLETFVKHGAAPEIIYDSKPHVGTDRLVSIVQGMRKEIETYGGVFLFDTKAVDLKIEEGKVTAVRLLHKGFETWVETSQVVLAIGHSARDTFSLLHQKGITMQPKDFAMGVRIEHKASTIQKAMYGNGAAARKLPAAYYKLTHQTEEGRGVYSFCMCPGGYVVNASSEDEHIAVNGMSYSGRNGKNSNSAIVVTVKTSDYMNRSDNPLCGMEFQRRIEKAAYNAGKGSIPVQCFGDFCNDVPSKSAGNIIPQIKGSFYYANVRKCLPEFMAQAIEEGIFAFEKTIQGFADKDAILSAVESRTSSPVRIVRDDSFLSSIVGIYPCGEGAGYAGGIVSAAVDGMKVAEAIIKEYQPKLTTPQQVEGY